MIDGARWTDQELAGRIARGDADGLREGWRRASGRAHAVTLRLLQSRSEADEALQDTFIEVWSRARRYDPARADFVTWVATIARSRAIDRLRAAGAVHRNQEGLRHTSPRSGPAPLQDTLLQERNQHVRVALRSLPAAQRTVIELAYFDGLSLRGVAEKTCLPLGTVKTRVRLALSKLAGILKETDLLRFDEGP